MKGKFIEYGDYDKNFYGTSFSSVQSVLSLNRTCVLNLHVDSIHKLRTPEVGKFFVSMSFYFSKALLEIYFSFKTIQESD